MHVKVSFGTERSSFCFAKEDQNHETILKTGHRSLHRVKENPEVEGLREDI